MKLTIHTLLLLALSITVSISQIRFQKTFGDEDDEVVQSVIQTSDDGYALAGYTWSFGWKVGALKMFVVKLDPAGKVQWSRAFGRGNIIDDARCIVQTKDGGFAIAGYSDSSIDGKFDVLILKLDSLGNTQWSTTIGGDKDDLAFSIAQTFDGGYAVAGRTRSFGTEGMYLIKLDQYGSFLWNKVISAADPGLDSFGGTTMNCLIATSDSGFVLAGGTTSFGSDYDAYIIKLDINGEAQWAKTIGGTENELAYAVTQTIDGGFALAGRTGGKTRSPDLYVMKLDSHGGLQWTRSIGGANEESGLSILQRDDGGYVVTGLTNSFGAGKSDMYIVRLESDGSLLWSKTLGTQDADDAQASASTADGGFVIAGAVGEGIDWNMYIVKFDAEENTCGSISTVTSSVITLDSNVSRTPTITIPEPTISHPVILDTTGGTMTDFCTTVGIRMADKIRDRVFISQNYPNPFNPTTTIQFYVPQKSFVTLKIYDAYGHIVSTLQSDELTEGMYERQWSGEGCPNGVYVFRLEAGPFIESGKLILIK